MSKVVRDSFIASARARSLTAGQPYETALADVINEHVTSMSRLLLKSKADVLRQFAAKYPALVKTAGL